VSHHLGLLLQKEKKKVSHSHQPSDFEQQPCQDRQLRQRPDRTAKDRSYRIPVYQFNLCTNLHRPISKLTEQNQTLRRTEQQSLLLPRH
jgi:hypothetical protein